MRTSETYATNVKLKAHLHTDAIAGVCGEDVRSHLHIAFKLTTPRIETIARVS